MCFVCVSASRPSGDHPNHIESSILDNGLTQTTYQVSTSGASSTVQALTDGTSWSATAGTAVTVSYSFGDVSLFPRIGTGSIIYSNNPQAFTAAQQTATLGVFSKLSAIANITFVEAANVAAAEMLFYFGDLTLSNTAGVAGFFTTSSNQLTTATVGMDDASSDFTTEGTYDYATLVHEIGHAVGLKHPGDYFNGAEAGPYLPTAQDTTAFTIMSYNDDDNNVSTNPTNFLSLDIEALQFLYGAASGASGSTGSSGPDFQTLSGSSNYAAGHGSDTVLGSTENDTIYGGTGQVDSDDSADQLYGGGGSDSMFGNSGNDTMYGGDTSGSVNDTGDIMWGGKGIDEMYGNAGNDQIGGGGDVYAPNDDGDTLYGGTGDDTFTGNGGNDTIYGDNAAGTGSGNDSIHGGAGNDSIVGGGGNDMINGGIGNDTMTGNDGADIFIFPGDSGVDVITDFVSGTDILQISNAVNGSSLTSAAAVVAAASASGSDLVIDLGGGNNVTLQNVATIVEADISIV